MDKFALVHSSWGIALNPTNILQFGLIDFQWH